MNGFWIGMLAFPLATAALALAVGAVLWAWGLWIKWAEERVVKSPAPVLPRASMSRGREISTLAMLNGRDGLAQLVMTSRKVQLIALGRDTGIIYVSGRGPFTHDQELVFASALNKAVQDLGVQLDLRDTPPEPKEAAEPMEPKEPKEPVAAKDAAPDTAPAGAA